MLSLVDGAQAVGVQLAHQAISADVLVTVAFGLPVAFWLRSVLVRGVLSHES